MTAPRYPLINGNRHDFSSIEVKINGTIFLGVEEITYSHRLEPGKVIGTKAQLLGRTRGQYEPEASLTLFKQEYHDLIRRLGAGGAGYMETAFDVVVSYSEKQDGRDVVLCDRIVGCRIKGVDNSHRSGSDALKVKVDLSVIRIDEDYKSGAFLAPLRNMAK
ncbi:MAG: hypothetical protein ACK4N5_25750 [Myxococcales bacterium]